MFCVLVVFVYCDKPFSRSVTIIAVVQDYTSQKHSTVQLLAHYYYFLISVSPTHYEYW